MRKPSDNKAGLLELFSSHPDSEFHMREIGRILQKEPGVFQRAINALVREGILKSEYRANARFFRLNKNHLASPQRPTKFDSHLNILINSTTDRICSRDRAGALLAWNKAFADSIEQIFGVTPYVGMKTWELIPPEQQEKLQQVRETYRRVFSGETIIAEYEYTLPDGQVRHMESSWVPLWQQDVVYAVGEVTRDITERKRRMESPGKQVNGE